MVYSQGYRPMFGVISPNVDLGYDVMHEEVFSKDVQSAYSNKLMLYHWLHSVNPTECHLCSVFGGNSYCKIS